MKLNKDSKNLKVEFWTVEWNVQIRKIYILNELTCKPVENFQETHIIRTHKCLSMNAKTCPQKLQQNYRKTMVTSCNFLLISLYLMPGMWWINAQGKCLVLTQTWYFYASPQTILTFHPGSFQSLFYSVLLPEREIQLYLLECYSTSY